MQIHLEFFATPVRYPLQRGKKGDKNESSRILKERFDAWYGRSGWLGKGLSGKD
jgi:hypothetical protein